MPKILCDGVRAARDLSLQGEYHRKQKASRKVIEAALSADAGLIMIGRNIGWKQNVALGKRTNQTFVSIPYQILIDMITYKAAMAGIAAGVVNESYTSTTSYLDGEACDRSHYLVTRRKKRGLFVSNNGTPINADLNAAYQIIKAGGIKKLRIREREKIIRINAA